MEFILTLFNNKFVMKSIIGFFLICMSFNSCINSIGTQLFTCKVEGNIDDKIKIYPVKDENGKRVKNYTVYDIHVSEILDSTNWEKVWVEKDLKPIKGTILYGQTNESKTQPFLYAKELKEKSTYIISFNLSSYWIGYGICSCGFNVDENGNAVQIR